MLKRTLGFVLTGALLATAAFTEDYTPEELAEIATEAGVDPAVLMVTGDVEYGEYLSGECTGCHQVSGNNDGIPSIIQWDAVYFMLAMHEYKIKTREHPVMEMIAGRLDAEEIAALAAYFAQLDIQ